ncbi:MAG: MFS transporter [Polyangia bacterium]
MSGSPPARRNLAILFLLYFAQGLPFGFQKELSAFLRQAGLSLTKIGLSRGLAAPWLLKALWAPLVDRYGLPDFGRRKSWIVPLQLLLALVFVAAAFVPPHVSLPTLIALVFLMNILTATQDIAVDGLAIDLFKGQQVGGANVAQVVGYKIGMLVGGGVLLRASASIGWRGMLFALAALVVVVLLAVLTLREPKVKPEASHVQQHLADILATLGRQLQSPAGRWLILFVGTYKIGETLVDSLYSSFLIDSGYTPAQIGGWLGIWGMVASTLGSLTGGFFASRLPILTAVALTSLLRVAAMGGECYLTFLSPPLPADILGVSLAEHFAGGALTTAMFAFMMMRVDKRIGASHYTVLASIEVLGKMPTGLFAGVMATHIGYRATFLLGTALSAVFLLLLIPLRKLPAVSPLDADSAS